MQIEKIGDSIRELLEKNEFLKMVMGVSDYIIYGFTGLLVLSQFISLGGFVSALLGILLVPLLVLAFAGKKYIGLIVLFSGQAFASLYCLIQGIYYISFTRYFTGNVGNIWDHIFGVAVFGLLLWLAIALFLKSRPVNPAPATPVQQMPGMPYQQPITNQQQVPPTMPQTLDAQPIAQTAVAQPTVPAQQVPAQPVAQTAVVQPTVPAQQAPAQPITQPSAVQPTVPAQPTWAQPIAQIAVAQPTVPAQPTSAQPIAQTAVAQPTSAQSAPVPPVVSRSPYAPPAPQISISQEAGQVPPAAENSNPLPAATEFTVEDDSHTAYQRPQGEDNPQVPVQQEKEAKSCVTPGVVCPQCGAVLPEENAYCTKCGRKLGE